ncbi:hypothetical protein JXA12_04650 [Candidatus Woesearchaeota archaeon]|nr:hypothetical protein [Candidatus Woesearchaeota archaeon]
MTPQELLDEHLSLFLLPTTTVIISFILIKLSKDWVTATAYGAWLVISFIALLFSGLFTLHNGLLLKWRMNWWKNLLLSGALFIMSALILILLVRVGAQADIPDYSDAVTRKLLLPESPEAPPPVAPCNTHDDCQTPADYLLQSNCPFAAACLEGSCAVVCPLGTACAEDEDCDCAERGDRTLSCACLDRTCVSVEDYITQDI